MTQKLERPSRVDRSYSHEMDNTAMLVLADNLLAPFLAAYPGRTHKAVRNEFLEALVCVGVRSIIDARGRVFVNTTDFKSAGLDSWLADPELGQDSPPSTRANTRHVFTHGTCSKPGCRKVARSGGLCRTHYQAEYRKQRRMVGSKA